MTLSLKEIAGQDLHAERFQREVVAGCQPVALRGLTADWPVVRAAQQSAGRLKDYLSAFDVGCRVEAFLGNPAICGKYYYAADFKGFNFERRMMKLLDALQMMVESLHRTDTPSIYVGSVPTGDSLPGFAASNPMTLLGQGVSPRIWLGTRSNVSCHHDTFDNLACVIAGRRRFTLFAPQLIGKLYVGPIDHGRGRHQFRPVRGPFGDRGSVCRLVTAAFHGPGPHHDLPRRYRHLPGLRLSASSSRPTSAPDRGFSPS